MFGIDALDIGGHALRHEEPLQRLDRIEVGAEGPVALSRGLERELPRGNERGEGRPKAPGRPAGPVAPGLLHAGDGHGFLPPTGVICARHALPLRGAAGICRRRIRSSITAVHMWYRNTYLRNRR